MIRYTIVLIFALLLSAPLMAADKQYEVTITNITKGQTFTPLLLVSHSSDVALFELGEAASDELATIAETGNIAPLQAILDASPELVAATNTNGGLLPPGESVTIEISSGNQQTYLSFAGMLVPTNDTFVAISTVELPNQSSVVYALAYDAGSEANDELCDNIPGPYCGDMDDSGDAGEGFVYVGNGINGIGDLDEAAFDWNNPVARVEIKRL